MVFENKFFWNRDHFYGICAVFIIWKINFIFFIMFYTLCNSELFLNLLLHKLIDRQIAIFIFLYKNSWIEALGWVVIRNFRWSIFDLWRDFFSENWIWFLLVSLMNLLELPIHMHLIVRLSLWMIANPLILFNKFFKPNI